MATTSNNRELEIAYGILSYLVKSPHAEDTRRGIMEWWLLQQLIEIEEVQVGLALKELVSRGLVIESESADKQILYEINRDSLADIRASLERGAEKRSL